MLSCLNHVQLCTTLWTAAYQAPPSTGVSRQEYWSGLSFLSPNLWILYFKCCSVTKSCPMLCDHMNCSTSSFPVFHYLPEFAQTQVHWVNDAIQPSHPLSPPSLPALNLSKCQGLLMSWLFTSCGQGTGDSASVLSMKIQSWFPLGLTCWSPCSSRDCQESSPTTQFEIINSSAFCLLYDPTLKTVHD